MAKKATTKKPNIKKATTKKEAPKPRPRISGDSIVRFYSNGLSKYMKDTTKVHNLTADHAQLLVDKGLGAIVEADIERVLSENA